MEVEIHRLGFGCRGAATNVHLKTKLAKVSKDVVEARDEAITRVEEKRAVISKEGGPTQGNVLQFVCVGLISPTHKRTEGRAPVWGSEFTSKRRRTTRGDPAETAVG